MLALDCRRRKDKRHAPIFSVKDLCMIEKNGGIILHAVSQANITARKLKFLIKDSFLNQKTFNYNCCQFMVFKKLLLIIIIEFQTFRMFFWSEWNSSVHAISDALTEWKLVNCSNVECSRTNISLLSPHNNYCSGHVLFNES